MCGIELIKNKYEYLKSKSKPFDIKINEVILLTQENLEEQFRNTYKNSFYKIGIWEQYKS